jgi:hypothetical protein
MPRYLVRANVAIRDLRAGEVGYVEGGAEVDRWIAKGWLTPEPDQVMFTPPPLLTDPPPPVPANDPPPPYEPNDPDLPDDYDDYTVDAAKEWVGDDFDKAGVAQAWELQHKNRVTLLEWLHALRAPELPVVDDDDGDSED